jgi:hypothetical protein
MSLPFDVRFFVDARLRELKAQEKAGRHSSGTLNMSPATIEPQATSCVAVTCNPTSNVQVLLLLCFTLSDISVEQFRKITSVNQEADRLVSLTRRMLSPITTRRPSSCHSKSLLTPGGSESAPEDEALVISKAPDHPDLLRRHGTPPSTHPTWHPHPARRSYKPMNIARTCGLSCVDPHRRRCASVIRTIRVLVRLCLPFLYTEVGEPVVHLAVLLGQLEVVALLVAQVPLPQPHSIPR